MSACRRCLGPREPRKQYCAACLLVVTRENSARYERTHPKCRQCWRRRPLRWRLCAECRRLRRGVALGYSSVSLYGRCDICGGGTDVLNRKCAACKRQLKRERDRESARRCRRRAKLAAIRSVKHLAWRVAA